MNTSTLVALVVSIAGAFFKNNPTVNEIEVVLPQLATAFDAAKAGTAFSLNHPLSVDGKAGTFSASWTPA